MLNRPINQFGLKDKPIVHRGLKKSFCTIRVNMKTIEIKERGKSHSAAANST